MEEKCKLPGYSEGNCFSKVNKETKCIAVIKQNKQDVITNKVLWKTK